MKAFCDVFDQGHSLAIAVWEISPKKDALKQLATALACKASYVPLFGTYEMITEQLLRGYGSNVVRTVSDYITGEICTIDLYLKDGSHMYTRDEWGDGTDWASKRINEIQTYLKDTARLLRRPANAS